MNKQKPIGKVSNVPSKTNDERKAKRRKYLQNKISRLNKRLQCIREKIKDIDKLIRKTDMAIKRHKKKKGTQSK